MATENVTLQRHIADGVEKIIKDALKAAWKNPKESAFLLRFAAASKKASARRMAAEEQGVHVPGFLIASITSACNLHCAGCYSRHNQATTDEAPTCQLSTQEWMKVFDEAEELGISFILLAGGEPLLRRSLVEEAGKRENMLFPIFTNGTFLDDKYLSLFDSCRNLIPIISLEGGQEATDQRRGPGAFAAITRGMEGLKNRGLLYGVSITVTTENLKEVTSAAFIRGLMDRGCRLVLYVEYVPVTKETEHLAPGDEERAYLEQAMADRRAETDGGVLLLSFPGDELAMGGCMAAGREFFHINSHGGAEPCPFSPYSDVNVKDGSLKEALSSPLFYALREEGFLQEEHKGGCVLYEKRHQIEALLQRRKRKDA